MEKQELGRFYATTFDETIYEFIVYSDNTIDCPILEVEGAKKIVIKPRFELTKMPYTYFNPAKHGVSDGLVKDFDINDLLFTYLKMTKMIKYSKEMAHLYGFKNKNGYGKGHPFKYAERKGQILSKQKTGKFN